MYRIHFAPRGAFWCVQFSVLQLFWRTVRVPKNLEAPISGGMKVLRFKTFDEARTYVTDIGIDKIYYDKTGEAPPFIPSAQTDTQGLSYQATR